MNLTYASKRTNTLVPILQVGMLAYEAEKYIHTNKIRKEHPPDENT